MTPKCGVRWVACPRAPSPVRWASAALLTAALATACGPSAREQEHRAEVQRRIEYWKAHEVERASSGRASPDPRGGSPEASDSTVPHLLCRDGTLSATCATRSNHESCCPNQEGVYVDEWGNVVLVQ